VAGRPLGATNKTFMPHRNVGCGHRRAQSFDASLRL
jgi:hypothetical protein